VEGVCWRGGEEERVAGPAKEGIEDEEEELEREGVKGDMGRGRVIESFGGKVGTEDGGVEEEGKDGNGRLEIDKSGGEEEGVAVDGKLD